MNESTDLTAKSILFAWELGANLGHIKPMAALARALTARGARATFAVRDLANIRQIGKRGEFTILQAPVWPDHSHGGHKPNLRKLRRRPDRHRLCRSEQARRGRRCLGLGSNPH